MLSFGEFTSTAATGDTVYFRPGAAGGFTVTAQTDDPESGIQSVTFSTPPNGSNWTGGGADSDAPYTGAYTFNSDTVDQLALDVHSTNGAGLDSEQTFFSVIDDSTPPDPAAFCDGDQCGPAAAWNDVTVTLTGTDTQSGLGEIRYTLDGSDPTPSHGSVYLSPFTVSATTTLKLIASDRVGNASPIVTQEIAIDRTPPADPADVAPPIDQTVATDFAASISFLYSGADPIQRGVAPGTIAGQRAAVLRGRVLTRDGDPLAGVKVGVLDHPELGRTLSRDDGRYDLAVNGGGKLTLEFAKHGFLSAQREAEPTWQDFSAVKDVALVPLSTEATTIDLGSTADIQVARGETVDDGDGARRATLLFPQGTDATMTLPDGSTQPLGEIDVRATEFTVGDGGPSAMPGELPPNSAYNYAVELSVDQALEAGATKVAFNRPVPFYLDNFRDFPVGIAVPAGYYDRQTGDWVASKDGVVLKILAEQDGRAVLDTDGDGIADSDAALAELGITDAERQKLAELYDPGKTLWRVPIQHFTPHDLNWAIGIPPDAKLPDNPPPPPTVDDGCPWTGSIIDCNDQSLGEALGVPGTRLQLRYHSERAQGRAALLRIPLIGDTVPASLKKIRVDVTVAGRTLSASSAPAPNLVHTFVWDGKDAYGRTVQGPQPYRGKITYEYEPFIYAQIRGAIPSFARFPPEVGGGEEGLQALVARGCTSPGPCDDPLPLWQNIQGFVGNVDAKGAGLGGWNLDIHHVYDPRSETLFMGDGRVRRAASLPRTIATVHQTNIPWDVAAAPDGAVYVATESGPIERVSPDGTVDILFYNYQLGGAGARTGGIALGPDGSLYVSIRQDGGARPFAAIYRWRGPVGRPIDEAIEQIAGGPQGFAGDGGPATAARFDNPQGLAVGPDGSLYVADTYNNRIRRIAPDGIITTVAGDGTTDINDVKDGGFASFAHLCHPHGVAAGPDGSLYIADSCHNRVRKVRPDGIISTFAGTGGNFQTGDGGLATGAALERPHRVALGSDGSLFISTVASGAEDGSGLIETSNHYVRRVNTEGIITTLAGTPTFAQLGDGGPPEHAFLWYPRGLSAGPNGALYIADWQNGRIRRIRFPQAGRHGEEWRIPSADGLELYVFDALGRHLKTVDTLTGATRWAFSYDAHGALATVTDSAGNVTTIEHAANGAPTRIVAPGGQQTVLTTGADGYLASAGNEAGEAIHFDYTPLGLLTTLTDPRGNVHEFQYDTLGRLVRDENPAGGVTTLQRVDLLHGFEITRLSAGRTTRYQVEELPGGGLRRTTTGPLGAEAESVRSVDGSEHAHYSDGTDVDVEAGPDPLFGMQAPTASKVVYTAPGGRHQTIVSERTAALADPNDPLSLQTLTQRDVVNGRSYVSAYDAATRTLTTTSPAGRVSKSIFDQQGRLVRAEPALGLAPLLYTYDAHGRLESFEQGPESVDYTYDARNRIASKMNAAGETTSFVYDLADRVSQVTLPSGRALQFSYDANGNRTAISLPAGGTHHLGFSPIDLLSSHETPGGDLLAIARNPDGQIAEKTLPGGRALSSTYDAGGRGTALTYPEATAAFSYASGDPTERPSGMTWTPAAGDAQGIAFGYSGQDVTSASWSGVATGDYAYSYDNNFFLTSLTLQSGVDTVSTPLVRDLDGLLTQLGPFSVTRGGPAGAPSAYADGVGSLSLAYDPLDRLSSKAQTVAGSEKYHADVAYDAAGRISGRTETVDGVLAEYTYDYDADGRLLEVKKDGSTVESYAYDSNGNRTMPAATYDSQDRLTSLGGTPYTFNADGFLTARGGDAFTYSARGELLSAALEGGPTVTYTYDGLGRRTGRTTAAGTTQYLYGDPGDPLKVTNVRTPDGTLTTLYYDESGLLFALERDGDRYYVASDQVGSPRIVTDGTGAIVKVVDYDAFGAVLADSNPSFGLPIGFAGGLVDGSTGLVHFGFRDYEPASARWTARDPVLFAGGDSNLYVYAGSSPIGLRDPTGLFCVGGSFYSGVGGGAKVCSSGNDLLVCLEVGFGLGGGGGVEGGMPRDGSEFGGQLSAGCGPATIGGGFALDSCGDLKLKGGGALKADEAGIGAGLGGTYNVGTGTLTPNGSYKVGPVTGGFNASGGSAGLRAKDAFGSDPNARVLGCKLTGKVYGQVCKKLF